MARWMRPRHRKQKVKNKGDNSLADANTYSKIMYFTNAPTT
jgi:hypothetical protein